MVSIALLVPMFVYAQRGRLAWPKTEGVYISTSSENTPQFARSLTGYRQTGNVDYWDHPFPFALHGSIRVFSGNDWDGLPDFPHTMNHCSDGVFMIRWRSASPEVRVASRLSGLEIAGRGPKAGSFGYMYGTNCEEPVFKFAGSSKGNQSTLGDIYYELKFWRAAP
jgi:hypothetical protein